MVDEARSRRAFLGLSGGALGAAFIAAHWPNVAAAHTHALNAAAGEGPTTLRFFDPAQARDVEAIAARIVPSDATPGAREAGAVYFIDASYGSWMAPHSAAFKDDLADFQAGFAALHPGLPFADADEATQIAYLESVDTQPCFQAVRLLTLAGLFALPEYGGNRGRIGWTLMGFDDQHAFTPPFGDYDRDYPGFTVPKVTS